MILYKYSLRNRAHLLFLKRPQYPKLMEKSSVFQSDMWNDPQLIMHFGRLSFWHTPSSYWPPRHEDTTEEAMFGKSSTMHGARWWHSLWYHHPLKPVFVCGFHGLNNVSWEIQDFPNLLPNRLSNHPEIIYDHPCMSWSDFKISQYLSTSINPSIPQTCINHPSHDSNHPNHTSTLLHWSTILGETIDSPIFWFYITILTIQIHWSQKYLGKP